MENRETTGNRPEAKENRRALQVEELGQVVGGSSELQLADPERKRPMVTKMGTNNKYCVTCGQPRAHYSTPSGLLACGVCGTVYTGK